MTAWSDDFTTDHFADSRYSILFATFTPAPSGGVLVVPASNQIFWEDSVRGSIGPASSIAMDMSALPDTSQTAIGFINPTIAVGYYGVFIPPAVLGGVAAGAGTNNINTAFFGSGTPPYTMTVSMDLTAQLMTVTVNGVGVFTMPVDSAICADISSRTDLAALAQIIPSGDADVTRWAYDTTSGGGGGGGGGGGSPGTYPGSGGGTVIGPTYGGGPAVGAGVISARSQITGLVRRGRR